MDCPPFIYTCAWTKDLLYFKNNYKDKEYLLYF